DHTFKVEPHGNVDHVVGSQEVQTHDLINYHSTRDREQHSAWELFSYREDSNEAAFAVAAVDKIYAHELLTFNNIVACEVIFKRASGLKDHMDARLDVYVLNNGCKKCSEDSDGYYWEYTSVRSQEYQMVCTRPDIASASVDMLDGFDRGLQTFHMEALKKTKAGYLMFTEAWKKEIWLKGLLTESRYELRLVAGIATGALVKAVPGPRFQHRSKLLRIGID
ncbi:hypothetical protein Tco_1289676, partial [Tanacetum coccineum]